MKHVTVFFLPYGGGDINPYQTLLADNLEDLGVTMMLRRCGGAIFLPKMLMLGKPRILHLHWLHNLCLSENLPKSLVKSVLFLLQIVIVKLMGIRIVWTAHNIRSHEKLHPKLDRVCSAFIVKIADGIIAHCETAKREVVRSFNLRNDSKIYAVPHGNYIGWYENKISKSEARNELSVPYSATVFLFLGGIRPYKGVSELINCFTELDHPDCRLFIAGKPMGGETAEILHQQCRGHRNITLIPEFVPARKIQWYMNACDVVVFPYRDILTSGAVLLAMSFGRACIAPHIGCIPEVLDEAGTFFYDAADAEGLTKSMRRALSGDANLQKMGEHNRRLAEQLNWKRIGKMTYEVYKSCLGKQH